MNEKQDIISDWLVLSPGSLIKASAHGKQTRFLLRAGKPIQEPVVKHGPFVMKTEDEINQRGCTPLLMSNSKYLNTEVI